MKERKKNPNLYQKFVWWNKSGMLLNKYFRYLEVASVENYGF